MNIKGQGDLFDHESDGLVHQPIVNESKLATAVAEVASVAQHDEQQFLSKYPNLRSFTQLAKAGKDLPSLKKIFGNYILEKSTTLFPSERGVGKSMLAMQIAMKVAGNAKEFLNEEIELNGNVLYINLELGEITISKRMEKLKEHVVLEDEFEAYSLNEREGFFKIINSVKGICHEKNPVLIIIDNLRTAFAGSDNERNHHMASIMGEVNKLKDEFQCAILIVHHTKKGSGNQLTNSDMQSGAGALSDLADADFFLRKSGVDKNYRVLKRVKARECEEQDGAKLIALNPETLWFEYIEDEVDECAHVLDEKSSLHKEKRDEKIIELLKKGVTDAEIARQVNAHRSTIGRLRKRIVN